MLPIRASVTGADARDSTIDISSLAAITSTGGAARVTPAIAPSLLLRRPRQLRVGWEEQSRSGVWSSEGKTYKSHRMDVGLRRKTKIALHVAGLPAIPNSEIKFVRHAL